MVFISDDEQFGSMVEDICCEAVHVNFKDVEYGPDTMHPSDVECSSIEDGDRSDDDKIKELYAEQALPAKVRVRVVESVEIVVDLTPSAASQVQDNRCVVGNLYGIKKTPLTIGGHVCLNFHKKVHGCLCRSLWAEREDGC